MGVQKSVNDMKIGEQGTVVGLGCSGALRRRIIDMGITPGAHVVLRKAAPMGDPLELNVRGYELSIRRSEAREILVVTDDLPKKQRYGKGGPYEIYLCAGRQSQLRQDHAF